MKGSNEKSPPCDAGLLPDEEVMGAYAEGFEDSDAAGLDGNIPSSGLDDLLSFDDEACERWRRMIDRPKEKLPSYNGELEAEMSGVKVPFHVVRVDNQVWDAEQAYYLALLAARIACDVIDVFRGRQRPARVERVLTVECMKRLKTASELMIGHMREDARLYAKIGMLPISVSCVDGWLVNPAKFECSVLLRIGETRINCNTSFIFKGSVWKCAVADFG